MNRKVRALRARLTDFGEVVVCFSGGVDSAYLAAEAHRVLGERAIALTAVSPSLSPEEAADTRRLAADIGVRHVVVSTHELDDPRYAANPVNRCYFCKTELYAVAVAQAAALGRHFVLDGFNADDRGDHRPGRKAGLEHGVCSPLDELGFTKADIRAAARDIRLPVWDKPAMACLSSRFPYGRAITREGLQQVAEAESALRRLGFRVFRVRHHGAMARVEVAPEELGALLDPPMRRAVAALLRKAGFERVTADLRGYRRGALNEGRLTAPAAI